MDKNKIIRLTEQRLNNQISREGIGLIQQYCINKGKDPNLTQAFIQILGMTGNIQNIYDQILEEYQREFEICLIKNDLGKIIKVI